MIIEFKEKVRDNGNGNYRFVRIESTGFQGFLEYSSTHKCTSKYICAVS